jgi:hypothetical protein
MSHSQMVSDIKHIFNIILTPFLILLRCDDLLPPEGRDGGN